MEKIFLSVLNMSLTSSFVIVAIMLARLPLKKAPKIISYALWAVAGFRLALPFTLESVFSLLPFKSTPIPQDIAMQTVPRIDSGITIIDNAVSAVLPVVTPYASVNPLQIWIFIGSYVWLFGIAVMLIYSFVSIILLKRRLRGAAHIEGNLYEAVKLKTPFVIGIFRPKIYIPVGLSDEERRYIVLHEQTHIRRYDHAVKMFAYLVLCLHWFNPLVWAAFVLMGADMEMSCDERVMRELGMDIKNAYSLSLVRVAAGRNILNGSPLAFGEGGMKERIKNVLNFKKPSRVIITLAVALVAVLSVGFAVNRSSDNSIDESKLLTRLGYSKELVLNVIDNRTTFSNDNEHISQIVKSLPLQADRKYISFYLEEGQTKEINIVYGYDENNYYRGGNGLDPFPETIRENNALLLFACVEGLEKVNFLHYDGLQALNRIDSYTLQDLNGRFGEIEPMDMSFVELYNSLAANIQLSEFYFAHYSRIYLGANFEEVSYRNGEPNEIKQQADGTNIWIYGELGKSYRLLPPDDREINNPGYTAIYYFNNPLAEKDDNLTGLYATMLFENDGESYDDLTAYLGYPTTNRDMGSGNTYIAYSLREGQQRNAYFILRNNKVIAQGVMYGNDYATLDFAALSDNRGDLNNALSTMRTPYVGDNSAVGKIVNALPVLDREHTQRFFSIGDDYDTGRAPFTLTVYYEPNDAETSDIRNITVTPKNSALLFALIDNLEEVNYAFRATPSDAELDKAAYTSRVAYSREDITEYLGGIELGWEDFQNDWNGSVEKMFAAIDENVQSNSIETTPSDEDMYDISQRVEDDLSIILSSPLTSSNPQDYINAHWNEYENLTMKYSDGVLEYFLSQFEAGNSGGLRGHIMMRMCKDMLGVQNNVTDESLSPQEWYKQLSIISEIKLPGFKPENPEGEYGGLIYSAIAQHYSQSDDGFMVAAPTVYGAYEEEGKLKIFVTVFYERYRLYGKTLESTGGVVIPGAIIFQGDNHIGGWIFEEYLKVGSANLPDGAYFNDSIRKLCVMPVSGDEIKGLAETMNADYVNDDRRELLMQNLKEHLTAYGQTGVSLKMPDGSMVELT